MKISSVHTVIHYACAIRCGDRFVKKITYLSFNRPKSLYCQIRLLVQQLKHTSCSRGKPRLFTITSHTVGKCLRRNKDHDSHSRGGSGRGLYANVDQSPLSWRGHVTPLDQWGPIDVEPTILHYLRSCVYLRANLRFFSYVRKFSK